VGEDSLEIVMMAVTCEQEFVWEEGGNRLYFTDDIFDGRNFFR
jgi:hypothetical protein